MGKRVKIPKPSNPPKRVELVWLDANYDTEHDGPSDDFAGTMERCPHIGYHVKNDRDDDGRPTVVLAGSAWVDDDGKVCSRYHMTIPGVHIIEWRVWPEEVTS